MKALKTLRTIALACAAVTLLGIGIASASGTSDGTGIIRATVVDKLTNLSLNNLCADNSCKLIVPSRSCVMLPAFSDTYNAQLAHRFRAIQYDYLAKELKNANPTNP